MRNKAGRLRGIAPTQVDYHWLWGLWVNRQASSPTRFGLEVERLLGDKDSLEQMKGKQERLARRFFVVRFFYWLFNVDNYVYHSHVLAACEAFKSTPNAEASARDDGSARASTRQDNSPRARQGMGNEGLPPSASARAAPPIGAVPPVSRAGIPRATPSSDPPAQKSASVVTAKPKPDVRVSDSMVAPLSVLGINKAVGDRLSQEEFKKIKKAALLRSHTDKGGVEGEFTEVYDAIKTLEGIFSTENTPQGALPYTGWYGGELAKLRAEMDAALKADRLEWDRRLRRIEERLTQLEEKASGRDNSLICYSVFNTGGEGGGGVELTGVRAATGAPSRGVAGASARDGSGMASTDGLGSGLGGGGARGGAGAGGSGSSAFSFSRRG